MFFKKARAFLKRDWLDNISYKSAFLFELLGMIAHILPFFFIAQLFGKAASPYLGGYGGDYFPFVLTGIAIAGYQETALNSFSNAILREQDSGTLEAILVTGTPLNTVIVSGSLWNFLATTLRVVACFLAGALVFGVDMSRMNFPASFAALALSLTSLAGLGILSAGFVLVFKKGNPVNYFLNAISRFLAGVYFPVGLFPLWVQKISGLIPLTYSLEAMRQAVLKGAGLSDLGKELFMLALFSILFLPASICFFGWAVRRAKKDGSLTFY